jgi:hypothetical protein
MKEFNIKITDTDVYINGKLQYFSTKMDTENHEDDLNKNNPDAFKPISNADLAHNREILKREYGFLEMNERVKLLIAELER